jgi:hypothetical protein
MVDQPVQISIVSPPRFLRLQLLLRILLTVALGWLGITARWLVGAMYLLLPLIAAIAISSMGAERYRNELAPRVWRVLVWLLELSAFTALLVDTLPAGRDKHVHALIRFTGTPTVGSALLRLLTSIPSGIVLSILWCVSGILWIVAALSVLFFESVPPSVLAFQRAVLRWNARLVAYHASLVDEYPPFALDTSGQAPSAMDGLHHEGSS